MVDILRMGREDLIYKDAHVWLFVCARAVGNLAPCQPLKRVPWGSYVCAVCMYTCHCGSAVCAHRRVTACNDAAGASLSDVLCTPWFNNSNALLQ